MSGIRKFTVSRDDSLYEAWPDVVRSGDRLICTYTECNHHLDRDHSRVVMRFSDDRGRTWSEKRPMTEYSDSDRFFNNSRVSVMPDGSLMFIVDRNDSATKYTPEDRSVQYIRRGSPDGTEWSDPEIIPFPGIVPDKYRVLSDGRHVIAAHTKNLETGKLYIWLIHSSDGGKTWSDPVTVAEDPKYNLCEASVLQVGESDLVCFMRENSGLGIDCLKTVSHDLGLTWGPITAMPIPGCHRPVSGHLLDGRIFLTYRFLQGGSGWMSNKTQNFFSAVFDDETALMESRSQMSVRIMPIDYDRSPDSDLGYSGWVQFDDGEIYIVNYIVDDAPRAQIRGYSLRPEDIVFGNG
ncbi:MAG: exo-alpha-sialidase [Clostridia bacterium]|nr:exo-alpha-sialidase [Clostridia bacterium]